MTMAGAETPAGEMMSGEMMAGEMMAGEMMAGETPAGEMMAEGACTNPADYQTLETLGEAGLNEAIGSCIGDCFTPGSPGCGTCLGGATGLSDGCTACFVAVTECTIASCVTFCIDSASAACAECREENCNPDFIECSGINP
jgi:hypothetical protein